MKNNTALNVGDIVLGKYEVTKVLHRGSMSNVYLVMDTSLRTVWCLKEAYLEDSQKGRIRYHGIIREAQIMKSLNHQGIPRIVFLEQLKNPTRALIVMDYVNGLSLQQILAREGALKPSTTVMLFKQLAAVMASLHAKGVFYRDLKPGNIMVQEGQIKLLDFGISEVVDKDNRFIREPLGTKGYAPPEQGVVGKQYDFRSDIYAFGVSLFQTLTGVSPSVFQSKEVEVDGKVVSRIDQSIPLDIRSLKSTLPEGLQEIVLKCTKLDPDERYQTFSEVIYSLQNFTKVDSGYIKKQKGRLKTLGVLLTLTIVCGLGSLLPMYMGNKVVEDTYQQNLAIARQEDTPESFVKAIRIHPERIDPYFELVESIKIDGEMTNEEQKMLLDLVNPNLLSLQNSPQYGDLAFNIGQLLWFYGESGNEAASTKWFEDAINYESSNTEQATTLRNLSLFQKNLAAALTESTDAGMYATYWNDLIQVKGYSSGELLQAQVMLALAQAIDTHVYRLQSDGVAKQDVLNEVKDLEDYLKVVQPSSEKTEGIVEELRLLVPTLSAKVEAAYMVPSLDEGVQ